MSNILVIKAFSVENRINETTDELQDDNFKARMRKRNFSICANVGLGAVFSVGTVFAIAFGAYSILFNGMTYGTVTAIIQLVNQVQSPFVSLSGIMPKYYTTIASAERIMELDDLPNEKEINQSDIIFVVTFVNGNDGKNFSMYCRTYDLAMEKVVSNTLYIEIERIEESMEKQRTHLGRINFVKVDSCIRISDVYLAENSVKRTGEKKGAFDDVKVKLNNPYKPYDLLKVPAWFGYAVVADVTNPRVKQFMEKNSHVDDEYAGWAEIAMPTWFLETTNHAAVPYDHINLSYEFETFAWPLSGIKKVEERDMTMGQVNMIKEIKRQVEETDNLNKIPMKRG